MRRPLVLTLAGFGLAAFAATVTCPCHADEVLSRTTAAPAGSNGQVVNFARDVIPALTKLGCNGGACHGSFQGRGGFRLSLWGFDPEQDYAAIVSEARGRRIFPSAPDWSLLLRKPLLELPHAGG